MKKNKFYIDKGELYTRHSPDGTRVQSDVKQNTSQFISHSSMTRLLTHLFNYKFL